ncbi:MAG: SDR family NAD(P)-dependent oxidoreductase [Ruminococcaceae bacterium]|nr:SDR family NAD(P)-dependent oxidoreductase [Oscillospiraceae bacterium]
MKVAAITGASGGIGRETAQLLAAEYRVYDLSRTGQDGANIVHIDTDVTSEESLSAAFRRIEAREGRLDLLICNAGIGIAGAAEFTTEEAAQYQINVNFFGVFRTVKNALPLLRLSRGRIVAISSAAATFPIPFQSFYSASKAAINTFVCALRNEVRTFGVSVCAIMPGDTKTGFTDARKKAFQGEDVYGGRIGPSVYVMEKDEQNGMPAEKVAKTIVRIAKKRRIRPLYTAGLKYKLFIVVKKLVGMTVVNWLIGLLYVKKPKKEGK